jgi:hypothetical protein
MLGAHDRLRIGLVWSAIRTMATIRTAPSRLRC